MCVRRKLVGLATNRAGHREPPLTYMHAVLSRCSRTQSIGIITFLDAITMFRPELVKPVSLL